MSAFGGKADIEGCRRVLLLPISALPPDQAAPLWQAAQATAVVMRPPASWTCGRALRCIVALRGKTLVDGSFDLTLFVKSQKAADPAVDE